MNKNKEKHYIMMKEKSLQENSTILNVHFPSNRSKYMNLELIGKSTIVLEPQHSPPIVMTDQSNH